MLMKQGRFVRPHEVAWPHDVNKDVGSHGKCHPKHCICLANACNLRNSGMHPAHHVSLKLKMKQAMYASDTKEQL